MITFIIVVVVFIVIKFIYDSVKQSNDIASQGGVRRKYSVLINHILSGHENAKIFQETNTFVSVGVSGIAGSTVFFIQQTYGNVTIQYKVKNNPILGEMNKEWTFPENMDQNLMIRRINEDLEKELNYLL